MNLTQFLKSEYGIGYDEVRLMNKSLKSLSGVNVDGINTIEPKHSETLGESAYVGDRDDYKSKSYRSYYDYNSYAGDINTDVYKLKDNKIIKVIHIYYEMVEEVYAYLNGKLI